jgi:CheY-like chemotaxis protein
MNSTILIIDDNLDFLELREFTLKRRNQKVYTANCGAEGLAMMARLKHVDLILLDVQLPDMTGPEFLDQLERTSGLGQTPVIYCTAGQRPNDPRVTEYLSKMTDLGIFHRHIEDILASRSRGSDANPRPDTPHY